MAFCEITVNHKFPTCEDEEILLRLVRIEKLLHALILGDAEVNKMREQLAGSAAALNEAVEASKVP
jgi:hypothetical protein